MPPNNKPLIVDPGLSDTLLKLSKSELRFFIIKVENYKIFVSSTKTCKEVCFCFYQFQTYFLFRSVLQLKTKLDESFSKVMESFKSEVMKQSKNFTQFVFAVFHLDVEINESKQSKCVLLPFKPPQLSPKMERFFEKCDKSIQDSLGQNSYRLKSVVDIGKLSFDMLTKDITTKLARQQTINTAPIRDQAVLDSFPNVQKD